MRRRRAILCWVAAALLFTQVAACSAGEGTILTSAPTLSIGDTQTTETEATTVPPFQTATATPALLPTDTASPEPPTPTAAPQSPSWYDAGTVALFVSGDNQQVDLHALGEDGTTRLILADVDSELNVSPDGRWLSSVRWGADGRGTLELHDVRSGESRAIASGTTSGLFRYAFDPNSRRLAFLDLGTPGADGVPWALALVDLESAAVVVRYEGSMAGPQTRPLPGAPVGWSGYDNNELIIDTFIPYTEGGWMGVWGVTLPVDGIPVALETLSLRELIPGAPTYSSQLYFAPDRQSIAFLGRDPDYVPDDYLPEFYDLAVNKIGLAMLDDGALTTVLETRDGSAFGRTIAWAPTGERLLFAQGHYEGENFRELALGSSDRSGNVVEYGPLTLPVFGGLLDLAWCNPSLALYVTWDGGDGTKHLRSFDLNTGISVEIDAAPWLEIVGCAP